MDKATLLRRCFLFESADASALDALAGRATAVRCGKDEPLFLEGDEGGALYIITDGLMRVWLSEPAHGKELTLAFLESGDVLGEIALLDGQPRSASATAVEDTELLEIKRSAFFEAVRAIPNFAEHLFELVCERYRANMADLNASVFFNLKRRLADKLIALALAHGRIDGAQVSFTRRFSQTELAQLLGVTREAINRQLSDWVRAGIVRIENGRLEILDLPALRQGGPATSDARQGVEGDMTAAYPILASPIQVGRRTLPNRVVMGSMHTNFEGEPARFNVLARFYAERAAGGAGLIVTGGFSPNFAGRINDHPCHFDSAEQAAPHRAITDAVHAAGGRILLQLLHSGRYGYHSAIVAPSPIKSPINRDAPAELSATEIRETIDDYGRAAALARDVGYDGVEVMGSEGYLISQFLATRTNHRTDDWGGPLEQRARFPVGWLRRCAPRLGLRVS